MCFGTLRRFGVEGATESPGIRGAGFDVARMPRPRAAAAYRSLRQGGGLLVGVLDLIYKAGASTLGRSARTSGLGCAWAREDSSPWRSVGDTQLDRTSSRLMPA